MGISVKSIFCFVFLIISCTATQLCIETEKSALLVLKTQLSADRVALPSWKPNTECCSWEGVTCHNVTGNVISLDLSGLRLSGVVNASNFLTLRSLQSLNLAYNDFQPSPFPAVFSFLRNLTYLNLSNSGFSGQVPLEIMHLSKLVSLDLSTDDLDSLKLENPGLDVLVRSLRNLRVLRLGGVNISSGVGAKWCALLPPNLQALSLSNCRLAGPICDSFGELPLLTELNLKGSNLSSTFPSNVFLLTNLRSLDISENEFLSGTLPKFSSGSKLEELKLSYTSFSGEIPYSISNLKQLTRLELRQCNFSGLIPSSLASLSQLVYLDLDSNKFRGWIPFLLPLKEGIIAAASNQGVSLVNLSFLSISNNSMEATIDSSLFKLPSLETLSLSNNKLRGKLTEDFRGVSTSALDTVDISDNNLEGPIPSFLFQFRNLTQLMLQSNNFSSISKPTSFKILDRLITLDISYNRPFAMPKEIKLTLPSLERLFLRSCNISDFPLFLRNQNRLVELDLSVNELQGEIPRWLWKETLYYLNISHNFLNGIEGGIPVSILSSLAFLDLSYNFLEGPIPYVPPSMNFLSLSKNKLVGAIPTWMCNMTNLSFMDICYNYLTGPIPQCLGDIGASLTVVNLRMNKLQGAMLWNFTDRCTLKTLSVYGNQLTGKIPASLSKCKDLEVLDLGNNQLNDTFPLWLGNLSRLEVIILQANRLHSLLGRPLTPGDFPMLHILDLSSNFFTGILPLDYIARWNANAGSFNDSFLYMGGYYYREWISITNKGPRMENINILNIFTVLDLSNNLFEGSIPEMIGDLKLLRLLNVSRNNLTGSIPSSLSELTLLESLDLSQNKLTGEIPWQLTGLTFLSVLNLSYNRLVGRIPQDNQFLTFDNDSFAGNLALCGLPLSTKCGDYENKPRKALKGSSGTVFDWKFALYGYGSGVILGGLIGYVFIWRTVSGRQWSEGLWSKRFSKQKRT